MARGARKSPKEKIQERLTDVNESIARYSECLEKMKQEKKELEAELEKLDIAELSAMLKERKLSVNEVMEMVSQAG